MEREQLPTNIKISHYDLELTPNFNDFTFDGTVQIQYNSIEPTTSVILNSKDLKIKSCYIDNNINTSINSRSTSFEIEKERVIFSFEDNIPQTGRIVISFQGILNDDMNGFYRSKYTTHDGKEKYMACTQFEAASARRAFPCGDEPRLKATFEVTMHVPKDQVCLSNTSVTLEIDNLTNNNLKTVQFRRTPIMSTYLLAFYVGEVEYVEKKVIKPLTKKSLRLRVYTPVGKKSTGEFALEVAEKCMEYYATYFNIDYPLNKLDMIGIPDFAAGAMENWGLVTYRTKYLLYDKGVSSLKMKSLVAVVVAHELAHMWFGNLVTMDWWNDLWLNEGFATWMEYNAADKFYPEFHIMEDFMTSQYLPTFSLDELDTSHPIEATINKASEVDEIFDTISYAKGASVIRMLVSHIGDVPFQEGIREYIRRFQYKNATTDDLWNTLSEVTGIDVKNIMNSWTKKQGYPIVSVNVNDDKISFNQSQYFASGPKLDNISTNNIWSLPLNIYKLDNNIKKITMNTKSLEIDDTGECIKVNCGQVGIYRTMYSDDLLNRLKQPFQNKELSVIDRGDIITNLFSFGTSGYNSVVSALDFCKDINESELYVLREIIHGHKQVMNLCFNDKYIYNTVRTQLLNILSPLIKNMGFDKLTNDDYHKHSTRCLVINTLGMLEDEHVSTEVCNRVQLQEFDPDQRCGFMSIYVRNGAQKQFAYILYKYEHSQSNEEKVDMLKALGTTKDKTLAQSALDFALKSGKVRSQDTYIMFYSIAVNKYLANFAWEYTRNNWNIIKKTFEGNLSMMGSIISYSLLSLGTSEDIENATTFINNNNEDVLTFKNKLQQSIEKVTKSISWRERDYQNIKHWSNINRSHSVNTHKLANLTYN